MSLQIMFTNSHMPFAPLIRVFSWSKYSHMVILIDDGKNVLHSDFHGVRIEPIEDLQKRSKNWMIVEYECECPEKVIEACKTQLGKPYDFGGIIGIALRDVNLQDDSKWWCSELPAYGFMMAGQPKFQEDFMHRITPQHWLMLPHKEIKRSI